MVQIPCILPKQLRQINMYTTDPTVVEDKEGNFWVGWSGKNYELLAKNLSRIADDWDSMLGIIDYLKGCIIKSREPIKKEKSDG